MVREEEQGRVLVASCRGDWQKSVTLLCDRAKLAENLNGRPVLLKPNLVEALAPPITTPAALVEAIVRYLLDRVQGVRVIVGEGCGAREYGTDRCFAELGYTEFARKYGIGLVDLNEEKPVERSLSQCRRWPVMHLPALVYETFLLSVPVLKAHSLAGVTLTMKNMMGTVPPSHYQRGGHWKKSSFHENMQAAVLDLNRYRTPDFTILDATVGMRVAHLWGPTCDPPPELLAASFDPVAIDAWGCSVLARDWRHIGHIAAADGELGTAEPLTIERIDHD